MPSQSKSPHPNGSSRSTDASQAKSKASRTSTVHSTLDLEGYCSDATCDHDHMASCYQEEGLSPQGFAGLHVPMLIGDTWGDDMIPSYSPGSHFRLSRDDSSYPILEHSYMLTQYLDAAPTVSERIFEPVVENKDEMKDKQPRKDKPKRKSKGRH